MPTLADILRQTGYSQDGTLATPTPVESPMTKVLAEHIQSLPQKFEQNQAIQMDLLGRAFPGNTYESMMTQGDPKALAELGMQVPFNAMIAYHGTPHNILGKFDISKVGTGEGAQAYGHGMYFAENPDVAQGYRVALSYDPDKMKIAGKQINDYYNQIQNAAAKVHPSKATSEYEKLELLENLMMNQFPKDMQSRVAEMTPETQKWFEKTVKPSFETYGNLYKVDIPDEYIPNMLDWDKPLASQDKQVLESLKKLNDPYINKAISTQPKLSKDGEYWEYMGNTYGSKSEALDDATPHRLITGYTGLGESPAEVSKTLNAAGIKGIRYLDQNSRVEGQGTRNFVVFDPSEVQILEKNSQPVSRKELIEKQINKLKD